MTTVAEYLVSLGTPGPLTAGARWQQLGGGSTAGQRLLSYAGLSSGVALYLLTQGSQVFNPKTLLVVPAVLRWLFIQSKAVMNMPASSAMQNVEPTAKIMSVISAARIEPALRRTILVPKE